MKYERIADRLSEEAVLMQVCEECGELIQACSKYLRVVKGENPSPVDKDRAFESLCEELADVNVSTHVMRLKIGDVYTAIHIREIAERKLKRWGDRLGIED